MEVIKMFKFNEIVYIENEKGKYTQCLFKGYINEKTCLIKPKEKFKKGGYGTTITSLVTNILRKNEVSE